MSTDPVPTPGNEGSNPGYPAEAGQAHGAELPDADERQRLGRAALHRAMLHKTFMDDLEAEQGVKDGPKCQPPDPGLEDRSGQGLP